MQTFRALNVQCSLLNANNVVVEITVIGNCSLTGNMLVFQVE